jgi:hypothetical protein
MVAFFRVGRYYARERNDEVLVYKDRVAVHRNEGVERGKVINNSFIPSWDILAILIVSSMARPEACLTSSEVSLVCRHSDIATLRFEVIIYISIRNRPPMAFH